MTIRKRVIRVLVALLLLPLAYLVVALVLSLITVNSGAVGTDAARTVFLTTNGVHLDIVMPIPTIDSALLTDLKTSSDDQYPSFGWGDENFYLNTATWGDLTAGNAFRAMFLRSSTLMHVTRYRSKRSTWKEVRLTDVQLATLNGYIATTFALDDDHKVHLGGEGYGSSDDFYRAQGSYSCLNTCNTWLNRSLKESGLKACLWTPFDFALLRKYDDE